MTKLLKIYGERHSGAVFLASLLRRLPGVTETPSGAHREQAAKRMRTLLAGVSGPVSPQTRRAVREAIVDDLTEADGPTGAWRHAAARFHSDFATGDVSVIFVVPSPWAWPAWLESSGNGARPFARDILPRKPPESGKTSYGSRSASRRISRDSPANWAKGRTPLPPSLPRPPFVPR